jgi:hypothetical protein
MPTKKRARKPKPDPDSRTQEFIDHLRAYDHVSDFEIGDPRRWPARFALKIGPHSIGHVTIRWSAVLDKTIHTAKPKRVSDTEWLDFIHQAPVELKSKVMTNLFGQMWHMLEYAPEKLNQAVGDLFFEAILKARDQDFKKRGVRSPDNLTEAAKEIGNNEARRVGQRLAIQQGGARDRHGFAKDVDLPLLVHFIDSVYPLWKSVTAFFAKQGYGANCIKWIKDTEPYQSIAKDFPVSDKLLRRVYRRKGEAKPELQPLGFAVQHAREALGIKWKHSTVTKHYKKARRELKKATTPPPDAAA